MDSSIMEKDTKMIKELNTAFKDIFFDPKHHQYFTRDGEELVSVTKLISKLKPKFNSHFWSALKAYEFSGYQTKQLWIKGGFNSECFLAGNDKIFIDSDHSFLPVTPEQVLQQWAVDSLVGTTRGTYAHQLLENLENRLLDKPEVILPRGLDTFQAISYIKSINLINKLCEQYVKDYDYLIPIAIEYKVGDIGMGVAGMLDRLYFNEKTQEVEIWDFKTDKKIAFTNKYQKINIFNIDDCEMNKYSIQTSFYKRIIEKNTNLKLGVSRIVHLNLKGESLDVYDCQDFTQEIANVDWRNI